MAEVFAFAATCVLLIITPGPGVFECRRGWCRVRIRRRQQIFMGPLSGKFPRSSGCYQRPGSCCTGDTLCAGNPACRINSLYDLSGGKNRVRRKQDRHNRSQNGTPFVRWGNAAGGQSKSVSGKFPAVFRVWHICRQYSIGNVDQNQPLGLLSGFRYILPGWLLGVFIHRLDLSVPVQRTINIFMAASMLIVVALAVYSEL